MKDQGSVVAPTRWEVVATTNTTIATAPATIRGHRRMLIRGSMIASSGNAT